MEIRSNHTQDCLIKIKADRFTIPKPCDGGFGKRSPRFCVALALWLLLPAASAPAERSVRNGCSFPIPERFVVERLKVWQERLHLSQWRISIITSHRSDLRPNTVGNIEWYPDGNFAVIQVLDPSDYQLGCRDLLSDMEITVVHELVHLELASLPRSSTSRADEEAAVNRITAALLALDRRR